MDRKSEGEVSTSGVATPPEVAVTDEDLALLDGAVAEPALLAEIGVPASDPEAPPYPGEEVARERTVDDLPSGDEGDVERGASELG